MDIGKQFVGSNIKNIGVNKSVGNVHVAVFGITVISNSTVVCDGIGQIVRIIVLIFISEFGISCYRKIVIIKKIICGVKVHG